MTASVRHTIHPKWYSSAQKPTGNPFYYFCSLIVNSFASCTDEIIGYQLKARNMRLLFSFLFMLPFIVGAQFTQNIRGTIVDKHSQQPMFGVDVILLDTTILKGASTDENGNFRITDVPVGRVSIKASLFGYNDVVLSNLELTTGKELILNLEIEELIAIQEVVITAKNEKKKPLNKMATVSARTFSIEESKRYAGSRNDVARMAQNFAGVQGADDSRNDIVVRGNSPTGVLYRLEGIDIPNPNHFALMGTTGGPVSILNNNVLDNSDFMTGAFPAEYGNALSGVFDLKLRNGNNEKHEFIGQIGFNGAELLAEGPISKEKFSSYLVSYRYSTLDLFALMGINFGTGTSIPSYQDVAFKFNFPNKHGSTAIFGTGGLSDIELLDSDNEGTNLYSEGGEDLTFDSRIGAAGITNTYRISDKGYFKTIFSMSASYNGIVNDSLSTSDGTPIAWYRNKSIVGKQSLASSYNHKFNARHLTKVGFFADRRFFDLNDRWYNGSAGEWQTLTDFDGYAYFLQPYLQHQYRLTNDVTFNAGIHYQHFTLNNTNSLEPRAGVKWKLNPKNELSIGYGLHSQLAPTRVFFEKTRDPLGNDVEVNRNIDMTKSHHFIVGYDRSINQHVRIKSEAYYQKIFDAVVDVNSNSYSMLNYGANFDLGFPDSLQNAGTGHNYGVEITFEHFLHKGFYYLVTASIYESKYKGSDGVERNTAFNGNYTFNALGGKEFQLKSKKPVELQKARNSILFDIKFTLNGGQRYTPFDLEASAFMGEGVYDYARAYEERYRDYFRIDLRLAYKRNGKKITQEWAFDIQNATNQKNVFQRTYNATTKGIQTTYQVGLVPIMQYRIEF